MYAIIFLDGYVLFYLEYVWDKVGCEPEQEEEEYLLKAL